MKIVLFGPEKRIGAWQGDKVIDLNRAFASYLREQRGDTNAQAHADGRVPAGLENLIALGAAGLEDADRAIQHIAESGAGLAAIVHDVNGVKLHFWKNPHEVAGPDEEIPYPKRTRRFDYEGEVAIVIGKRGKNIPADRIDEYVWGVTLFHDWSIRDGGSSGPQGRPISYNLPKNFDGCASMGPCIVVGELDHRNVDVETRINGEVRQSYNTKEMIWPFGEVLEYLSQDFTFVPGDVIAGGTSAGTAADMSRRQTEAAQAPNLFLKIGDVVELSSPQIGKLGNRIVQA